MENNFRTLDPEFGNQERFSRRSTVWAETWRISRSWPKRWGEEENTEAEVWRLTCPDQRIQNRSLLLQAEESGDDSGKRWSYGALHWRRTNEHTGWQSGETERMWMWGKDTSSSRSSLDLFISATFVRFLLPKNK